MTYQYCYDTTRDGKSFIGVLLLSLVLAMKKCGCCGLSYYYY